MLLQNRTLHAQYPYTRRGASLVATEAGNLRSQLGIRGSSQLARFCSAFKQWQSVPQGYGVGSSVFAPVDGGGMGASAGIDGTASLAAGLALGKALEASIAGAGAISPPSMSLLVQAAATLAGIGGMTSAMVGSVSLTADLAGEGDVSGALGVIAWMTAELLGEGDATGQFTGYASLSADITPYTELSPETLAAAVWNALAAQYTDAGSMGEKLSAAGSAGDPWSTALPGSYAAGTAGDKLSKALSLAKFIGLK